MTTLQEGFGVPPEVSPEAVADARRATNTHYELPPAYFQAFLDTRLKYSSGLYGGDDLTLEEAQTRKLHFVGDSVGMMPGTRVLDIGCGWGSLTLFVARERGCTVTGVTPAQSQADFIMARAAEFGVADRVDIRVGGFTDLTIQGRYDAVTMLGSIIHMPDRVRVLTSARELLRPGGRLYLSESCFRNEETYESFRTRPGTLHVTESTFGFADMVPFSRLIAAAETAGFSLVGLTDLTEDYGRTIDVWIERATANADAIDALGVGSSADLLRYLKTANAGWGFTSKHYALVAERRR